METCRPLKLNLTRWIFQLHFWDKNICFLKTWNEINCCWIHHFDSLRLFPVTDVVWKAILKLIFMWKDTPQHRIHFPFRANGTSVSDSYQYIYCCMKKFLQGCKARLKTLDLSSNMLMALPTGNFKNLASSLTQLDLSNNTLHTELMNPATVASPLPPQYNFTSLRILDLSSSQLQIFNGSWVSSLVNLIRLDLSCNKIKRVSRDFFVGLPPSLQFLNMSFCVTTMPDAPKIDKDAFSALGENVDNGTTLNFKTLILSSGYFRGWILKRLALLPVATRAGMCRIINYFWVSCILFAYILIVIVYYYLNFLHWFNHYNKSKKKQERCQL